MKDIHFQAAETHAASLADKLMDIVAEDTIGKILRDAEVRELYAMMSQAKNIEKNVQLLRQRVIERTTMLKGQKS